MDWMTSIQETINYMEENIGEDLSVELLAERIYISPFYFQKVFTILCDCTVSEYIRNRRLTLAGYEVVDTNEYQYVKKRGWNQITEVVEQSWGGKTCSVTTIDGSILTFFE